MTHRELWTPSRVLMGATDGIAYCQGIVEHFFGPLLYQKVLAWLHDILRYAKTEDDLLYILKELLETCARFGLKLNPNKCKFFERKTKCCGKIISGAGVSHFPEKVSVLVDMKFPTTPGQLQQFLCAVNGMRCNIPHYSKLTTPLYNVLEEGIRIAKSRKKVKVAKLVLESVG
uniref:Putative retroelement putative n=1 Tax=Albugo laibachii Nc14 TaxID=890382 RepID=F0WKJ7_9STRA|nr:Putative retroelement putative [Albugo laibachii Nc14]|eukprot:CCA21803.1 Putative retroelement putative [Albugo laibachii Nc14]